MIKKLSLILAFVGIAIYLVVASQIETPKEQYVAPIKIAMSTTPLSSPLIIAQKLSLFEKHQVHVELLPVRGGHRSFSMMTDGEVDLATSSGSVVMFNSFLRKDFTVLASFVESDNDLKLITLKSSSITEAKLLEGKNVGMIESSASEFFIYAYMILTGNKEVKFNRVFMDASDLGPALLSGKVDAISIWEPLGYQLNKEYGEQISQFQTKGIYNLSFNLIAKKATLESSLESYVKVLAAIDEAQNYIAEHPKRAKSIVSDFLNIPVTELEWGWSDYLFRLSLSNVLLSNLQTQARWAIATDSVTDTNGMPDFRLLIDGRALERAGNTDTHL
ncbi:ABC transporter substrate-binding protein [Shewanella atlantica]|uniref:ABC transporter substrate-binding protein n=1 Tax=Shewanella atlantica TaxID=271099 RepID=A0A3S0KH20_9GAMM|nr:ABC transporter substrate-binding protein [Shewanella atlantica]RTR30642.1 ABC transporter substrate-binding protein [Shewanella atlantica]